MANRRSWALLPAGILPSQHLSMLLVRSYRTFAPLPVPANRPSAVCFCGTLLTVTRTGRYQQARPSRAGLSSNRSDTKGCDRNHLACFQTSSCLAGIIGLQG